MDIVLALAIGSFILALIVLPPVYKDYKKNFPYIRKKIYEISNKEYKVKIFGKKECHYTKPQISKVKRSIRKKFEKVDFKNTGDNYITILIDELPSTFTIKMIYDTNNEYNELLEINDYELEDFINEEESYDTTTITIEYDGIAKFKYNDADQNKHYLSIMEDLFDIIKEVHKIDFSYVNYSLTVTFRESFDRILFENGHESLKCEDVKLSFSKKVVILNSKKIFNIYDCLLKNVSKFI